MPDVTALVTPSVLKWREEEAADCGGAYERPSDT